MHFHVANFWFWRYIRSSNWWHLIIVHEIACWRRNLICFIKWSRLMIFCFTKSWNWRIISCNFEGFKKYIYSYNGSVFNSIYLLLELFENIFKDTSSSFSTQESVEWKMKTKSVRKHSLKIQVSGILCYKTDSLYLQKITVTNILTINIAYTRT